MKIDSLDEGAFWRRSSRSRIIPTAMKGRCCRDESLDRRDG
jgi:hypothetical protein